MVHFKGDYWSVDPWMYRKATRIVRNHCGIHSTTDCCDFMVPGKSRMLKRAKSSRLLEARVFHYCLLYTSDAADDTPCVDLGGRRIIKKNSVEDNYCLLYTSPSPRDLSTSRMPSSA